MEKNSKIYVAGHDGMVGSAIIRRLKKEGYNNIIYRELKDLDLTRQADTEKFFETEKPEYVFLAAAKVGGIHANNTYPADFIYINLQIQNNIIYSAYKNKVKKLLFLGSSCIYPKNCPQPIKEEYLLTGELEKTNEAYAIAKIAGLKMCEFFNKQYGTNFISVMPTNLYGPNDNFDLENSHVLPALLRKIHEAKVNKADEVIIWGSGKPRREFLHVDDLARACTFLMNIYKKNGHINIGTGNDITIEELTFVIKKIVGYDGRLIYDTSKPDGTKRKMLDISKLANMGFKANITLDTGIKSVYEWYLKSIS
jgi:GDP-L-fucose synthase